MKGILRWLGPVRAPIGVVIALLGAGLLTFIIYQITGSRGRGRQGQAFVLRNKVIHARLLPEPSKHAFAYPTLSLLLSLNSLEKRELDLGGGLLFGYGTRIIGRLTGISPMEYVFDNGRKDQSIRTKLEDVLGMYGHDPRELHDAWMMTMPAYLGFSGINPLTVYFCYKSNQSFWLVVLEIHNTFGERHAHVLEVGKKEDALIPLGFAHSWTFDRRFHVSPFNDRSGTYICSVSTPSRAPQEEPSSLPPPKPVVRVQLYTAEEPPRLKLTAVLRPVESIPMTIASLLWTLFKYPFELLLTSPRILLQAKTLHYDKRLDIYGRPEPYAHDLSSENLYKSKTKTEFHQGEPSGGIGWQKYSILEKYARSVVLRFFAERAKATGINVTIRPANPFDQGAQFGSSTAGEAEHLVIHYRSPRFFVLLLSLPSLEHALALGRDTESLFAISSDSLCRTIFHIDAPQSTGPTLQFRIPQRLRSALLWRHKYPIPPIHPIDQHASPNIVLLIVFLLVTDILARLEKPMYALFRARFVPGDEPWSAWDRVGADASTRPAVGSVLRRA